MTKSILLVGVGGQGTILASKILTMGLMKAGYDVKMSEIHGMSQRGGSVSSQIRYGDCVESPVIDEGGAQLLIAFEKMEALRWINFLDIEKGRLIVNDCEIPSMSVIAGDEDYDEGINDYLSRKANIQMIDAQGLAENLGSRKVMNIILLGAIVKIMKLEAINWTEIICENVKPDFSELNIKAFQTGMNAV